MAAARSARPKPGSPEETPEDRERRIAAIKAGIARRRAAAAADPAARVPPPRREKPHPARAYRTQEEKEAWIEAIKAGKARRKAGLAAADGSPALDPRRSLGSRGHYQAEPLEDDRAPVTDRDRLEVRREIERGTEPRRIAEEFGVPLAVVNAIRFSMEASA